jgi:hypothetical protein
VVVGSSGLSVGNYAELDRLARDRGVGVVAAGNFSIMAAILKRAAAQAAQHLQYWEILDYASVDRPDVPSTSGELAETLGEVRMPQSALAMSQLGGPVEARGTGVAGTRIHLWLRSPCVMSLLGMSARPSWDALLSEAKVSHLSFSSGPKFMGSIACLLGLLWDRPGPWSG